MLTFRVSAGQQVSKFRKGYRQVCYDAYHQLQEILEKIDSRSKESKKLAKFRGNGLAGVQDIMYGNIRQTPIEDETVVGLQKKFLFTHL